MPRIGSVEKGYLREVGDYKIEWRKRGMPVVKRINKKQGHKGDRSVSTFQYKMVVGQF